MTSNEVATGGYGEEPKETREHILARHALKRRYEWELEAIAQDIMSKLEMEVLTVPSIGSYLSNLLMSHPRTKLDERAAETLMFSSGRTEDVTGAENLLDSWPVEEVVSPALRQLAYLGMGRDIIITLAKQGVRITGE